MNLISEATSHGLDLITNQRRVKQITKIILSLGDLFVYSKIPLISLPNQYSLSFTLHSSIDSSPFYTSIKLSDNLNYIWNIDVKEMKSLSVDIQNLENFILKFWIVGGCNISSELETIPFIEYNIDFLYLDFCGFNPKSSTFTSPGRLIFQLNSAYFIYNTDALTNQKSNILSTGSIHQNVRVLVKMDLVTNSYNLDTILKFCSLTKKTLDLKENSCANNRKIISETSVFKYRSEFKTNSKLQLLILLIIHRCNTLFLHRLSIILTLKLRKLQILRHDKEKILTKTKIMLEENLSECSKHKTSSNQLRVKLKDVSNKIDANRAKMLLQLHSIFNFSKAPVNNTEMSFINNLHFKAEWNLQLMKYEYSGIVCEKKISHINNMDLLETSFYSLMHLTSTISSIFAVTLPYPLIPRYSLSFIINPLSNTKQIEKKCFKPEEDSKVHKNPIFYLAMDILQLRHSSGFETISPQEVQENIIDFRNKFIQQTRKLQPNNHILFSTGGGRSQNLLNRLQISLNSKYLHTGSFISQGINDSLTNATTTNSNAFKNILNLSLDEIINYFKSNSRLE